MHPKLAGLEPPDAFGVIHAVQTIRHCALVRTQVNTYCSRRAPIAQAEARPFPRSLIYRDALSRIYWGEFCRESWNKWKAQADSSSKSFYYGLTQITAKTMQTHDMIHGRQYSKINENCRIVFYLSFIGIQHMAISSESQAFPCRPSRAHGS
jgi:hypothetical protein